MTTLTFSARDLEAIGRGPWTSRDWYEAFLFLVQSCGIVFAGGLLYVLGPTLGITLLVGGLATWSTVACCLAATRAPCHAGTDGEHDVPAASTDLPSHGADAARLKRDHLGATTATARRPVLRQGA